MPQDKAGAIIREDHESTSGLAIPLVVGPQRSVRAGEVRGLAADASALDVIVNPWVTRAAARDDGFRLQLVELAFTWVEQEAGLALSRAYSIVEGVLYRGGTGDAGSTPVPYVLSASEANEAEEAAGRTGASGAAAPRAARSDAASATPASAPVASAPALVSVSPQQLLQQIRAQRETVDAGSADSAPASAPAAAAVELASGGGTSSASSRSSSSSSSSSISGGGGGGGGKPQPARLIQELSSVELLTPALTAHTSSLDAARSTPAAPPTFQLSVSHDVVPRLLTASVHLPLVAGSCSP
jgi:hypothetical protein